MLALALSMAANASSKTATIRSCSAKGGMGTGNCETNALCHALHSRSSACGNGILGATANELHFEIEECVMVGIELNLLEQGPLGIRIDCSVSI